MGLSGAYVNTVNDSLLGIVIQVHIWFVHRQRYVPSLIVYFDLAKSGYFLISPLSVFSDYKDSDTDLNLNEF